MLPVYAAPYRKFMQYKKKEATQIELKRSNIYTLFLHNGINIEIVL